MNYKIAVLPGDGIGPEVVREGTQLLSRVAQLHGFQVEYEEGIVGGASIDAHGKPLTDPVLKLAKQSDAVLLGAMGGPKWDALDYSIRPERALLALRQELGLFANLRPVKLFSALASASTLKREVVEGTDLLVVRELTGGLYFGEPRWLDLAGESAVNTLPYSGSEIERIATVAFEAARTRRRHVTLVDKANVLETSQLWRHVTKRVASRYPDVRFDMTYVDSCALRLVLEPSVFDVILTENLFGDILSDEAGAIAGSLGLLPSASIGGRVGLFEPVHGSAPTLVGTNSANPVGAIASAAMLLEYGLGAVKEAKAIDAAIGRAFADGCVTKDLAAGGVRALTCAEMTQAIVERL